MLGFKKASGKNAAVAALTTVTMTGTLFAGMSVPVFAATSSPKLETSEGWVESAYTTWDPVSGADGYNVYYKGSNSSYTQLDDELIRLYSATDGSKYFRADAVGLAAGNYVLKVVPVVNGKEVSGSAAQTSTLSVTANDRSGFAFTKGTSNGAYESNGTLQSDAVVLYVTEKTKDTVTMDVVTSAKGAKTTGTGLQNILDLYKKGYDSRPLDIRIIGQITDLATMEGGDIAISGSSSSKRISCGITVEGIGSDATADGWGLRIKNATDVEVRNIGFMNCDSDEGDDVGLQQSNDHVWVHNCDFFYGDAGTDADQVKGDGALDTKTSTYITHSYNHFWDNGKCNLQGMKSESTTNYITYHHNWYDHSDSRNPRIRTCSVHIYNNYYDGNAKYGVGATMGSSAFVESNYFRNCKYPMLISEQGTDVITDWAKMTRSEEIATFSGENGGIIKAYNNTIVGASSFVTYQTNKTEFDAYEVSSATEKVPSSVKTYQGATSYNNFDTDSSIMYSYTADDPATAKTKVENYAGRVDGGDFQWEFDDSADDTSSAVNTGLKAALNSYKTKLVSVGGGSVASSDSSSSASSASSSAASSSSSSASSASSSSASASTTTSTQTDGSAKVLNFTENGTTSSFYTVTGTLSTQKGSVAYNNLDLTTCLKMEKSSAVSFTADKAGTLTIVLGESGEKVKVDGKSYTSTSNVITVSLSKGSHTITKGSSANIFYVSFS